MANFRGNPLRLLANGAILLALLSPTRATAETLLEETEQIASPIAAPAATTAAPIPTGSDPASTAVPTAPSVAIVPAPMVTLPAQPADTLRTGAGPATPVASVEEKPVTPATACAMGNHRPLLMAAPALFLLVFLGGWALGAGSLP